jgi:hypothetical protein
LFLLGPFCNQVKKALSFALIILPRLLTQVACDGFYFWRVFRPFRKQSKIFFLGSIHINRAYIMPPAKKKQTSSLGRAVIKSRFQGQKAIALDEGKLVSFFFIHQKNL